MMDVPTLRRRAIAVALMPVLLVPMLVAMACADPSQDWQSRNPRENTSGNAAAYVPPPVPIEQRATAGGSYDPAVIEAAAILVGDDVVTVEDVIVQLPPQLRLAGGQMMEDAFFRQARPVLAQAIRRAIGETLLFQKASRELDLTSQRMARVDQSVERVLNDVIARQAGGSRVEFVNSLAAGGLSLDMYKNALRRQLVGQQFLQDRIEQRVVITRRAMQDYYNANRSSFGTPQSAELWVILIRPTQMLPEGQSWDRVGDAQKAAATEASLRKAEQLASELNRGGGPAQLEAFKAAARQHSAILKESGGEFGRFAVDELDEGPFRDAAFSLASYAISEPVPTDRGVFLIHTGPVERVQPPSFTELQPEIRQRLRLEALNRATDAEVQRLYERAGIDEAALSRLMRGTARRMFEVARNAG